MFYEIKMRKKDHTTLAGCSRSDRYLERRCAEVSAEVVFDEVK